MPSRNEQQCANIFLDRDYSKSKRVNMKRGKTHTRNLLFFLSTHFSTHFKWTLVSANISTFILNHIHTFAIYVFFLLFVCLFVSSSWHFTCSMNCIQFHFDSIIKCIVLAQKIDRKLWIIKKNTYILFSNQNWSTPPNSTPSAHPHRYLNFQIKYSMTIFLHRHTVRRIHSHGLWRLKYVMMRNFSIKYPNFYRMFQINCKEQNRPYQRDRWKKRKEKNNSNQMNKKTHAHIKNGKLPRKKGTHNFIHHVVSTWKCHRNKKRKHIEKFLI